MSLCDDFFTRYHVKEKHNALVYGCQSMIERKFSLVMPDYLVRNILKYSPSFVWH